MITEEKCEYLKDLSSTSDSASPEFGKVSFIAFSAAKNMFALYADSDSSGNVIVCRSDLAKELNR